MTAPGILATFQYDPLNRRSERKVNGSTTTYLYDGKQAIGEVRAGATTSLLTGLTIDEAIARYTSIGRQTTQLTDQLGSVIRQITAAGTTQNTTSYSPYGEATTSGDDQGNSTEYTGRENDDTGLYFYRARYYDPEVKRFVSEDPIGLAGGINIYAYVLGNPLSYTDPDGLMAGTAGGAVAGGMVAGPPGAVVGAIIVTIAQALAGGVAVAAIASIPGDTDSSSSSSGSRSIPVPAKPSSGCTCICRADANQNDPRNSPAFALGTATECDYATASKVAKRNGTKALGQQPKHVGCRCTGR